MKSILFPTDFSEAASRAFVYALHIADKFNATITTLNVYRRPEVGAMGLPRTMGEFRDTFDLDEFKNYKDSIPALRDIAESNGFGHLQVNHVLEEGSKVVETILEVSRRDEADLIVMGTTGARGLRQILMGSVTGEVLENADCPVLAVPENAEFDGIIDRISFTTTYTDEEKKALTWLEDFARPFQSDIYCVNVDTSHTHFYHHRMDRLKEELKGHVKLHFDVVEGNELFKDLTDYLNQKEIDILAMITHKRNFLQELFSYSHAKVMSYHSSIPILSIQAHLISKET